MKYVFVASIAALLATSPAHAIGCFIGSVAGAAAGHVVHHGVVGQLAAA